MALMGYYKREKLVREITPGDVSSLKKNTKRIVGGKRFRWKILPELGAESTPNQGTARSELSYREEYRADKIQLVMPSRQYLFITLFGTSYHQEKKTI